MAERTTYRLDLAYDGSGFSGFRRVSGSRTVESVLLAAIAPVLPEVVSLAVGGQTDSGVHALGQVVSLYGHSVDLARLVHAVRTAAPEEIVIRSAGIVPRRFHARASARRRRYRYRVARDAVDCDRLAAMLAHLREAESFDAYARDTDARGAPLDVADVVRSADAIWLDFAAAKFLRRQVRVMVSTLLRCATSGEPVDALLRIARAGDRAGTEPPAPARDLALMRVDYHDDDPLRRIDTGDPLPLQLQAFAGLSQ